MLEHLTVEERLTALEQEFQALKQQLIAKKDQRSWIEKIAGTFKDDPDFEEIVRRGHEFRKAAQ